MTQMKGGLNSRSCAGPPLPRDFGHFASPSWLTRGKKTNKKKKKHNESANEGKKNKKMECPGIYV